MSNNYIQPGEVIDYANSGSAIASGDLITIGARVGVALVDIGKNETGSVAVDGVFELPKATAAAGDAYSPGDEVKMASGKIDSAGSTVAGYAFAAVAKADTTMLVKINA